MRCRSEEAGSVGEEEDVAWAWAVAWASVQAWAGEWAVATPIPSAVTSPGFPDGGGQRPMLASMPQLSHMGDTVTRTMAAVPTPLLRHPGTMAGIPIMGFQHRTPGGKDLR